MNNRSWTLEGNNAIPKNVNQRLIQTNPYGTRRQRKSYWRRQLLIVLGPILSYGLYKSIINLWVWILRPYLEKHNMLHWFYKYIPLFWNNGQGRMNQSMEESVLDGHESIHGVTLGLDEPDTLGDVSIADQQHKTKNNTSEYRPVDSQMWGDESMVDKHSTSRSLHGTHQMTHSTIASLDITQYKINELSDKWDKLSSTVDDLRDIIRELKVRESYSDERDRTFTQRYQHDINGLHTTIDSIRNSDIKHVRDMVFDVMKKQHDSLMHLSPIPQHRANQYMVSSPPPKQQSAAPINNQAAVTTTIPKIEDSPPVPNHGDANEKQEEVEEEGEVNTSYNFVEQITGARNESVNWESIIESHEKNLKDVNNQFDSLSVQINNDDSIHQDELDSLHSKSSPINNPEDLHKDFDASPTDTASEAMPPQEDGSPSNKQDEVAALTSPNKQDNESSTEPSSPELLNALLGEPTTETDDDDSGYEAKSLQDQLKDRSKVPTQLVGFLEAVDTETDTSSTPSQPIEDSANLHHMASIEFEKWIASNADDSSYSTALAAWEGDATDVSALLHFQTHFYAEHYNAAFNVSKYCKAQAKKQRRKEKAKKRKPWQKNA